MPSVWLFELSKRLDEEIGKEMTQIGSGSCSASEASAEQVAMRYNERIGYVMGLSRARVIAEEMERQG